jgi:hypothetical protein
MHLLLAHHEMGPSLWPLLGHLLWWLSLGIVTGYVAMLAYLRKFR